MAKEILITGASGLVGSRFAEQSRKYELLTPDHHSLDIGNWESIESFFSTYQPDLVINFAAYTNVTEAENQTGNQDGPCWQINVIGVQNLLKTKVPLIQISTDMVFSGAEDDPGPYSEDYPTESNPSRLTWYGWSKNQAEKEVLEANQTVVRIIYPVRTNFEQKRDYLHGPLHLFSEGKLYPLFNDQQVSFTFIDELTEVLHKLVEKPSSGIFHVSSDTFTPYELVAYAVEKLGGDSSTIQTASIRPFLEKQINPYRYPVKGGLLAETTQDKLGIKLRTWQEVVDALAEQGLSLDSA